MLDNMSPSQMQEACVSLLAEFPGGIGELTETIREVARTVLI